LLILTFAVVLISALVIFAFEIFTSLAFNVNFVAVKSLNVTLPFILALTFALAALAVNNQAIHMRNRKK